jgi:hypothetical protein
MPKRKTKAKIEIKSEDFHSGVAEDLTLLEYDALSISNQTVSQVRKGETPKDRNTRKKEQMVWEDRDRWRDVPYEVEMYGEGGVREAERMKAMFRTGK